MNIFLRLLRLPFVTRGNPLINVGLWVAITLATYKTGNVVVTQNEPVRTFSPYGLINYIITKFIKNRNSNHGSIGYWFLETAFSFAGYLINSIGFRTSNQVQQNQMPHIVAGRIDSSNIIPNMQGQTFIIGFSEEVSNYVGFLFVFIRAGLLCFAIIFLYRFFINRHKNNVLNEVIDVKARPINRTNKSSSFIQKYWEDK